MKHLYESEILNKLMERDGLNIPSTVPPYEAEIKAYLINQVKLAYPKLTDYEAEWLLYNYTKHLPAEFPISSVSDVTTATFTNVVPFAFKSAILSGSTKYRDIDTGDILDTFDETKNLELVSVKMPVLTTTGKNLFNGEIIIGKDINDFNGTVIDRTNHTITSKFTVPKNKNYKVSSNKGLAYCIAHYYKNDDTWLGKDLLYQNNNILNTSLYDYDYLRLEMDEDGYNYIQLEEGSTATEYEPYKSNILTVNEDVELGSVGEIKDELNLLTGEITSYSYNYTITGDEPWTDWANDLGEYVTFYFYYKNSNMPNIPNEKVGKGICNKFKVVGNVYNTQQRAIGIGAEYLSLGIKFNELNITSDSTRSERVNALKTWLKNNNVEIRLPYAQEVVKTVDLTTVNENGEKVYFMPLEGTMHVSSTSETIQPTFNMSVPVEATTQNLASFINLEMEE